MEFKIETGIPIPKKLKTGPKAARNIVNKAAADIRLRKFDTIQSAAKEHFPDYKFLRPNRKDLLDVEGAEEEKFKYFCKCIADELKSGPKSMHVFRVLSRRTKNKLKQSEIKKKRMKEMYKEIKEILNERN